MRASSRWRWAEEQAAIARQDSRWEAMRMESRRRFHVVRAWLGAVLPAALSTARSGALGDAALLLAGSLGGLRRPWRRWTSLAAAD